MSEAIERLVARIDAWEAGKLGWTPADSKRLEIRCGDLRELRDAARTIKCALALFDSLKGRGNNYSAARVDGPLNWSIIDPRSQEAIGFACNTDEHAILERMADVLVGHCGDNLERAFVLARACLAAALPPPPSEEQP